MKRDFDAKARPLALAVHRHIVCQPDTGTRQVADPLHDRQAQPRSGLLRVPLAVKALEDPLPVFGADAGALVGDAQHGPVIKDLDRDRDAATRRRKFDGVVDEIPDQHVEHRGG